MKTINIYKSKGVPGLELANYLHGHEDKKKGKHKNDNTKQRQGFAKTIHVATLYSTARLHPCLLYTSDAADE